MRSLSEDLLGIALERTPSASEERAFETALGRLKCESVVVSAAVRAENLRLVRLPSSASDAEKRLLEKRLARHPLVRQVGPALDVSQEGVSFLTTQLRVRFKAHVTLPQVAARVKNLGLSIVRAIPYAPNTFLLRDRSGAPARSQRAAALLAEQADVEYAEPNLVVTGVDHQIHPADFLYDRQWHLPFVNLPLAWEALRGANPAGVAPGGPGDLTFGRENLVIAVMDRGIQSRSTGGLVLAAHPDFAGSVTGGESKVSQFFDFSRMTPDNDVLVLGHGMSCGGVVGALTGNPAVVPGEVEGSVGVAPNCRLMALVRPAGGTEQQYADAYVWAAGFDPGWTIDGVNYFPGALFPPVPSAPADIVTNSFGITTGAPISGLMSDTVDFLTTYGRRGRGIVFFYSSGSSTSPAGPSEGLQGWIIHPKTLGIAASTDGDVHAPDSCYGRNVFLCAPSSGGTRAIVTADAPGGGDLWGHTGGPSDYTSRFGGTSSATPLVAGVAALVLSANPSLTWIEVREILRRTAVRIDPDNTDPIGRWSDTDLDGVPDFSQWYGYGRVDAERAVTAALMTSPDRDIVVRDNLADRGDVPTGAPFWDSPDVWVRNTEPVLDTGAVPATYDDPPEPPIHQPPLASQDNWVYVRLKNRGTAPSLEFFVRVYVASFPGTEFTYPASFIPTTRPGEVATTPLRRGAYLIGELRHASLGPGGVDVVQIRWPMELVPPERVLVGGSRVAWHPCLLVEVTPHDGPTPSGDHVFDDNNLAQKNLTILYPTGMRFAVAAAVGSGSTAHGKLDLVVDRSSVPADVDLFLELRDVKLWRWLDRLPPKERSGYNFSTGVRNGKPGVVIAARGGTRIPLKTGIAGAPALTVLRGRLRKKVPPGRYRISFIQKERGGRPVGGLIIELGL